MTAIPKSFTLLHCFLGPAVRNPILTILTALNEATRHRRVRDQVAIGDPRSTMPQAIHRAHWQSSDTLRMHNCMELRVGWTCAAIARSKQFSGSIRRQDGVSSEGYQAFGLPVLPVNNLPFHSRVYPAGCTTRSTSARTDTDSSLSLHLRWASCSMGSITDRSTRTRRDMLT